jgi:prepilin signal peptidase PulO-like enzyme (type II secretory pathway)
MLVIFGIIALAASSQQQCSYDNMGNETCQTVTFGPFIAIGVVMILAGIGVCIWAYMQYAS